MFRMKTLAMFTYVFMMFPVGSVMAQHPTTPLTPEENARAFAEYQKRMGITTPIMLPSEVIAQKRQEVLEQIQELQKAEADATQIGRFLVDGVQEHMPFDWGHRREHAYASIAYCQAAAEIKSATLISVLADHFDLHIMGPRRFYRDNRFKGEIEKIENFPVMHLAMVCGEKALPVLQRIILDEEKPLRSRVEAFVLSYNIDEESTKGLYSLIADQLDSDTNKMFTLYLADPSLEPWNAYLTLHHHVHGSILLERRLEQISSSED